MTKILISPGYGAGWSTWHDIPAKESLTFEPLIEAIEKHGVGSEEFTEALKLYEEKYPDEYLGGAGQLEVVEVEGPFAVEEYDGNEYIVGERDLIEL